MNDTVSATLLGISASEHDKFEALLGYREREERGVEALVTLETTILSSAPGADAIASAARVSPRASKMIVDYETGGRAYYDKVIEKRPIWPKGSSGITIGSVMTSAT